MSKYRTYHASYVNMDLVTCRIHLARCEGPYEMRKSKWGAVQVGCYKAWHEPFYLVNQDRYIEFDLVGWKLVEAWE